MPSSYRTVLIVETSTSYLNIEVSFTRGSTVNVFFKPLQQAQILVSPGPRSTPSKFRKSVSSGQYLLPAFPASLLIATDIQISIPSHSLPPKVITDLLALSYEPLVSGGYGPFSFGRMYGDNKDGKELYKFRVQRENGSLLLSLPGGQLIGYACHIVVKFPASY